MTESPAAVADASEAAIFARLWDAEHAALTPDLARHVLGLAFGPPDVARMRDLAARHRDGLASAAELEELDNYVRVGDLLAVLQSKARRRLGVKPPARPAHG